MILQDTHVLLWWETGNRRLGPQCRHILETALREGQAAVSAISFWELSMRAAKGHLELPFAIDAWRQELLQRGIVEIPVDGDIAIRAGLLRDMHGDPADRIIVATAQDGHQLMTADRQILGWGGDLLSINARS